MNPTQELQLADTRFGSISYREEDVLHFEDGLIGFPSEQRFVLVSSSDSSAFHWLQSLDSPDLAFLVTEPRQFFPEYEPFTLEATDLLLSTVNIPHGCPEEMTLNLVGPILIDQLSRHGCQIVLDDEAYTTKYRVFAKASTEVGEKAA